jgi:hypothetical protein
MTGSGVIRLFTLANGGSRFADRQGVLNLRSTNADQARMQLFLYEIVARIVAIYLCIDCWRRIRNGLAERKIAYYNTDLLNWLLFDWSNRFVDRDTAPVSYWITMGLQITSLAYRSGEGRLARCDGG